jgi:hypothetical protein
MRLPRKGIIIRLLIYVPLLGYFGWHALERWRSEQPGAAEDSAEATVDEKLAPYKKVMTFPDGTKQEIYELTPEEAASILGHELPPAAGADRATPKEPSAPDEPPSD